MNGSISTSEMINRHAVAYGSIATYSCNEGFSLIGGNSTRTCRKGDNYGIVGVWDGLAPRCECTRLSNLISFAIIILFYFSTVIRCSPLNGIKNGNVTYSVSASDTDTTDPLPFGSMATYLCDEHFNLTSGNQTRICGVNSTKGVWSGVPSACSGKLQ